MIDLNEHPDHQKIYRHQKLARSHIFHFNPNRAKYDIITNNKPLTGRIYMYYIYTPRELADAIAKKQESFEINGDLIEKVLKIKNTGTTAWIVAIGAISFATVAALTTTKIGKITTPLTLPIATFNTMGAVPILGISTATAAVEIAVAFGGVNVLNTLRKYKIIENSEDKLILQKP